MILQLKIKKVLEDLNDKSDQPEVSGTVSFYSADYHVSLL